MGTPEYDRDNTRRINLKLNNKTDADIIAQLETMKSSEGIQGYLKRLIREDIGRVKGKWIEAQDEITCSICRKRFKDEILYLADLDFCPSCGAVMKGGRQHEQG